jgi:hypothetical protein
MFFVNLYFGIKLLIGFLIFTILLVGGIWSWYDNNKDKYRPIELEDHPLNGNLFYETGFFGGKQYRLCTGKGRIKKKPISDWILGSSMFGEREWIQVQHKKGKIRWLDNYGR